MHGFRVTAHTSAITTVSLALDAGTAPAAGLGDRPRRVQARGAGPAQSHLAGPVVALVARLAS